MSRVYLHNYKKANSLINKLIVLLILFVLYGFYKNGVSLYRNHYVSLWGLLKPLALVLFASLSSFSFALIFKEKYFSYRFLCNILCALITPIGANILVYCILLLVFNVIYKYYKFNMPTLYMIVLIIIMFIMKDYSFLNIAERGVDFKYSIIDLFLGKGAGGFANTFLIYTLFCLSLLSFDLEYKKKIPFIAIITFYVLLIITCFMTNSFDTELLFNNNLLFAVTFIAPISIFSPYSKGAMYLYGFLLGLMMYVSTFIDLNVGVYFSISILSMLSTFLDKIIVKNGENLVDVL